MKAEGKGAQNGYAFRIEVSNVPSDVCKRIHDMNPSVVDKIEPASTNCGDGVVNLMTFYFDGDFSSVSTGSSGSGSSSSGEENTSDLCDEGCGEGQYCEEGTCKDCSTIENCATYTTTRGKCECTECIDGYALDATTGECKVEEKDIETLCAGAQGTVITIDSEKFCQPSTLMLWDDAKDWCEKNGMKMPSIQELCPSWDGTKGIGKCPELKGKGIAGEYIWSATDERNGYAYCVELSLGYVGSVEHDDDYYDTSVLCY